MGASSSICSVEVLQTEFAALKPTLSTAEMEKLQGTFDRTTADKNKTDLEIIAECVVCWASLDLLQKSPAVQVPPTESILVALNEDTLKIILSFLPPHLLTTTIPQTSAAFNHISLSRVIWGPIADKANKFRVEQTVGRERGTVDGMLEAINRLEMQHFCEMKAFKVPPNPVILIVGWVAALLEGKVPSPTKLANWKNSKKMLNNPRDFREVLRAFKYDNVETALCSEVRKELDTNEDMAENRVMQTCQGAGFLREWMMEAIKLAESTELRQAEWVERVARRCVARGLKEPRSLFLVE